MSGLLRLIPAFVLLFATACGAEEHDPARIVTDDLGRRVGLPERVARVVSLAPSVTETAFVAGAGDLLVAVTDADDHPPGVALLPRIQALPLDFEAVVALRPDLILASDQVNDPRDAERLEELGIATYFVSVRSLEDVFRSVVDLGELLNTRPAAERAADSLRRRLDSVAVAPPASPADVLILIGDDTLFAFGDGSYVHDMVRRAGGRSVTASFDVRAPVLSDEYVIDTAPDVIVGAFGTDYPADSLVQLHPQWTGVPAVRTGRVYTIDPDLLLRPGPRLVDGVKALADLLAGSGP